ncbi:MAG: Vitamin K epoxide reductase [Candidatus Magasanikbacteria bacterium GW2011_GWA2_56_11]|uniref:Vitamin K epoxide reductase n=1 Tax=Candidatus Magasanikbacteria bacterium GW2011_GWA2_56_11 TaxID=1619044 RepID=A0A0G1YI05_9BACT|nr:MAG: Vitamin K epoxide reductase [Candidatus Magasanikbacteria bacterium GW2011_GWA2_56_11]
MRNLRLLLNRRHNLPKWLSASFLAVALIGFADATYLAVNHYRGNVPPCAILRGCETVTSSSYSMLFSTVPVALLGALYYLTLLVLIVGYLDTKRLGLALAAFFLTPLGFIASLYFFHLQLNVIGAWCVYCLGSIASSTLLFALGGAGAKYKKLLLDN